MATRRTPQGRPRRGSRRDQVQRNIRPGARGTDAGACDRGRRRRDPGSPTGWRSWSWSSPCWWSPTRRRCAPTCSSARTSTTCAPRSPAPRRDIKALEREKRRWADDEYVKAQARERFGWVMPGETSYQVIDREREAARARRRAHRPQLGGAHRAGPLVGQGLRHARGGRPPQEGAHAGDAHHAVTVVHSHTRPVTGAIDSRDVAVVAAQLGRPPRSIHAVAHRCPCGNPDVVATEPRLDDGTPVPDDVLPDLPARGLEDRHARGLRA